MVEPVKGNSSRNHPWDLAIEVESNTLLGDGFKSYFNVYSGGHTYLTLSEAGCLMSDGSHDCTALCANTNLIWGGPDNLDINAVLANIDNCMQLLVASSLLDRGVLDVSSDDFHDTRPYFLSGGAEILNSYGIKKGSDIDFQGINASIFKCLYDYCEDSHRCNNRQWMTLDVLDIHVSSQNIPDYYAALCPGRASGVNSDAAGLGILSGYLIVLVLSCTLYVALRICWSWLQYLELPYHLLKTHDYKAAWRRATVQQQAVTTSRYTAILISSLADFQRAQCFFWLATAIASMVALRNQEQTLGADSIGGIRLNMTLIMAICDIAIHGISFGYYFMVIGSGKRCTSVFIYSMITTTICITVVFLAFTINPLGVQPGPDSRLVPSCGLVPPTIYCDEVPEWRHYIPKKYILLYYVAHAAFAVILMCLTRNFIALQRETHSESLRYEYRHICFCIEAIFIGFSLFYFIVLVSAFTTRVGGTLSTDWGFGQIVAVIVWVPVVMDWILAMWKGLDKASDHRIIAPYKMIRTDTLETSDKPDDQSSVHGLRRLPSSTHSLAQVQSNSNESLPLDSQIRRRRTDLEGRLLNESSNQLIANRTATVASGSGGD